MEPATGVTAVTGLTGAATRRDTGAERGRAAPSRRAGALAGAGVALLYLATMPVFAATGAPPSGAEARLAYHAASGPAWWAIIGLSVLTDLLLVPFWVALHEAVRPVARGTALVAGGFAGLFVVLDLAVTWPAYASLAGLGGSWPGAGAAAQAGLVAAAGAPAAVLESPLHAVYSVLTLSLAILLVAGPGRAAGLGRAAAAAGVATGVVGVAATAHTLATGALSPLTIAASLLTVAWLGLVARGLWRTT